MKFCPNCGTMMFIRDDVFTCNCGYTENCSNDDESEYIVSQNIQQHDGIRVVEEDINVGPVTNETCPECGHDKATYKMLQTRSADEAPTRIFTCTNCKHTWRAYN